jgi:membrane-bound lytic murein transglycosylase D
MRARLILASVVLSGSALAAGPKGHAKGHPAQTHATHGQAAHGHGATRPHPTATADPAARRLTAGGPTADDVRAGVESPELAQLRAAERELFPPAAPQPGNAWPSELPAWPDAGPTVSATGLPAPLAASNAPAAEGGKDLSWLSHLTLPDLPVRWDARVVRYLEMYKTDPRARGALAYWRRRSGRYKDAIERVLRSKNLPIDLEWIAMIESGFDPTARSPAGAVGLWQFMPETGRLYGLPIDRFVDERVDVIAATEAAANFLSDLHRRFGSWDLAMASYNMGYLGVVAAERKYNTNDFWALSKLEGSLPWETTLYVPKILASAVVMRNPKVFGLDAIVPDPPIEFDEIQAPFGVSLSAIAKAAGLDAKDLEQLNPELRAKRTPPKESEVAQAVVDKKNAHGWALRVPSGKGPTVVASLSKIRRDEIALERYVVRFGETLDQVAQAHGTTSAKLADINGIQPGELVRGGTLLLVPHAPPPKAHATGTAQAKTAPDADKPVAVVPTQLFVYPGRKRVFYKVSVGDTIKEIADAMHVTVDELRRWNDIDPAARLQDGMTLQAFVQNGADLSRIALLADGNVRVITVGTDEFFSYFEKTRRRVVVTARAGDKVGDIGKRYGLSGASMERINRRSRRDVLKAGETVVVYVDPKRAAPAPPKAATPAATPATSAAAAAISDPVPLGAPPPPPRPDLLPPVSL